MACGEVQLVPLFARERELCGLGALDEIVPVTACIFAGWRRIHASATVVFVTLWRAAISSSLRFSSGYFSLPMKAPSKKPYWNGDHVWIVMSWRRQ